MPGSSLLSQSLYQTILSQCFSNCGRYLIAGSFYGQIAIYDLQKVLDIDSLNPHDGTPDFLFFPKDCNQVCSLQSTKKFLIAGVQGKILGWSWGHTFGPLNESNPEKCTFSIDIPASYIDKVDVNSLLWRKDNDHLLAGCGDNKVHCFDLSNGKLVRSFEGHEGYIHSIDECNNILTTASEDGTVRLWDSRTKRSNFKISPHSNTKVARSDLGKWIGSVSIMDDWIVCGGGPRLSLWQAKNLEPISVFNLNDHGIHVTGFFEDRIIAGGAAEHLYQITYTGENIVEIPVSATTAYSVVYQTNPNTILSIAGSSDCIDFCTNFNYKDRNLYFR